MSDALPERVWLHGFETYQGFSTANLGEHCYVPEQRALDAERERDALRVLAYIGEHRFPDLTYKARLEETVSAMRALRAERDALQSDLTALLPLVKHYEGYAITAAIRAGVTDLRVGAPPEVLAAGKRYAAILDREGA